MYINELQIISRLLFAALIGIVFGTERKHRNKPIGARTHVLITLAASTIAMISSFGFVETGHAYPSVISVSSDPARLVVGMLTGIGFLGAGIIYKSPHGDITGVTTAAEVYLMTVLGIGAGMGLYMLTATAAVIAYAVLICSETSIVIMRQKYNIFWARLLHKLTRRRRSRKEQQ